MPKGVALSDVLRRAPHLFSAQKVNAVDKAITVLDALPPAYHNAQVVYLSKNNLSSLQGMQQFQQVKVLSLADNLLPDVVCLQPLAEHCPRLEVLSLEGNLCAAQPYYRPAVVRLLPSLRVLDGLAISRGEREACTNVLEQDAAVMAVMVSNACLVHKLVMTSHLAALHIELRETAFQGHHASRLRAWLPESLPSSTQRLLKLWDYEGQLAPEERQLIVAALRRETMRAYDALKRAKGKGPSWQGACAQVMLGQQQSITHLVSVIKHTEQEALRQAQRLLYSSHTPGEGHPAREGCQQAVSQESSPLPRRPVAQKAAPRKPSSWQATPTSRASGPSGPGASASLALFMAAPPAPTPQQHSLAILDAAPPQDASSACASSPVGFEQDSSTSYPLPVPSTAVTSSTSHPHPHPAALPTAIVCSNAQQHTTHNSPGTSAGPQQQPADVHTLHMVPATQQQPAGAHTLHTVAITDRTSAADRLQRAVAALRSMTPITQPPATAPPDPPSSAVVPKRLFPSPAPPASPQQPNAPIPCEEAPIPLYPPAAAPSGGPASQPTSPWPAPGPARQLHPEHPAPSSPPPTVLPQPSRTPLASAAHAAMQTMLGVPSSAQTPVGQAAAGYTLSAAMQSTTDPGALLVAAPGAGALSFSEPPLHPGLDAAVLPQPYGVPDGLHASNHAAGCNAPRLAAAGDTAAALDQAALRWTLPAEQCTSPRSDACLSYNAATGDLRFVTPLPGSQGFGAPSALQLCQDGAQHIHVHLHQGPQQEHSHACSSWPASPQSYASATATLPPPASMAPASPAAASTAPASPAAASRHCKDSRDSSGSARLAQQVQELQAQMQHLVQATPRGSGRGSAVAMSATSDIADRPVPASREHRQHRQNGADCGRPSGRRRTAAAPPQPQPTEDAADGVLSPASTLSLDEPAVQPVVDIAAHSALQEQVQELLKEKQAQREREQALEEQLKACKQHVSSLEGELKASKSRSHALEDDAAALQGTIDRQAKQLLESEAAGQKASEQATRTETMVAMYRKQLGEAEGARTAAEKKLSAAEAAVHNHEHELGETFQELKSLSTTYNTLLQEWEVMQSDHKLLQQKLRTVQEELAHSNSSLEALRTTHQAVSTQSQELQQRAALLDSQVEQLQASLEAAKQEKRKLATELTTATGELDEVRQHLGSYKAKTDVQLVQLQTRCADLQQELEGTCGKFQAAHHASEQHLQSLRSLQQDQQQLLTQHEQLQQDHLQLQQAHQALQQQARQDSQTAEALSTALQAELQSVGKRLVAAEDGVAALKGQCSSLDGMLQQELQKSSILAENLVIERAEAEKVPGLTSQVATLQTELAGAHLQLEATSAQNAGLLQQVDQYQKELQQLLQEQCLRHKHLDAAEAFHERHLLSRVLCAWASSTKDLLLRRRVLDTAVKRSVRKSLRMWIRRLRTATVRSIAMRRISSRRQQSLLRHSLGLLARHAAACRQKRQRELQSVQHWKQVAAFKSLQAWWQVCARLTAQHAEPSPADSTAAVTHWRHRLQQRAWTGWKLSFLLHHKQPQLQMMARAAKRCARVLLARSLRAWKQAVARAAVKCKQVARAAHHNRSKLVSQALCAWLRHLAFQHNSRKAESTATFFLAGRLFGAWHRLALRAKLAQQRVATCQHRKTRLLKAYALQGWKALLAAGQQALVGQQLAAEHCNSRLLRASMAAWRLHWRLSMAHRTQQAEQAVGSLHRAAQHWWRVSSALAQWSQTKRMAAMLWQRRQLQTMQTCFQAWHRLVVVEPQHREPLHRAVLGVCCRRFLQKVLTAWYRQVVDTSQQRLQDLQDLTHTLQASCSDLQAQLAGSQDAKAQLESQLQVLEGRLLHSTQSAREQAAALQARLQEALDREEAAGAELEKLQARLVEATAEQQAAQHQAAQQQARLQAQAAQLQQQDDLKDQQAAQLADTQQKMLDLRIRLREHDELVRRLQDEGQLKAAALADAMLSREAAAAELARQRSSADREVAGLKQQLADTEATLTDREDAIAQMKQMLQAGDADLEAAHGQLSTMAKALSSQMQERTERIALLEERIREVEAELTSNRSQHSLQISDMQDELERARGTITKQQFVIKQAALFAHPVAASGSSPGRSPVYALQYATPEAASAEPGGARLGSDGHAEDSEDFPITAFIAQQTAVLRN